MSDDSASFLLKLIDEVSGPAGNAGRALRNIEQQMSATGAAGRALGEASAKVGAGIRASAEAADVFAKARAGVASKAFAAPSLAAFTAPTGGSSADILAKARAGLETQKLAAPKLDAFTTPQLTRFQQASAALKYAWKEWTSGGEKAGRDIESAGRHMQESGGFLKRSLEFMTGTLLERAVEKFAELGKEMAFSVVEAANFGQRAEVAFKNLAKYGADGGRIFEHVQDLAESLGMSIEGTTEHYQEFLAMQFNPDQADALIKMGADMKAIGASTQKVTQAFNEMAMIKSMDMMELRQLRIMEQAGVSGKLIMEALVAQTGLSMEQVRKKLSDGSIKSGLALNAIGDAIKHKTHEKYFGEAGKEMADSTIDGLWGQLKAGMERQVLKLGKAIAPVLTTTMKGWLSDFTDFVGSDKGQQFFLDLASSAKDFARAITSLLPSLKEMLGLLSDLTGKSANVNGTTATVQKSDSVVQDWRNLSAVNQAIANDSTGSLVGDIQKTWAELWGTAYEAGEQTGAGMAAGIRSKLDDVAGAGAEMGQSAVGGASSRDGIDAHSPSRKFGYLGEMSAIGYAIELRAGMNDNAKLAASLASDVADASDVALPVQSFGGDASDVALPVQSFGGDASDVALPAPSFGRSASSSTSASASGRGGRGPIYVTINISGISGDPEKIAEAARRGTMQALGDVLDQIDSEAA